MSGWIKLHRKINDNPILKKGKTYSSFEAFIWLLLRANFDEAKVVVGSEIYIVKKGEMITSQKKLCKQFNWGNTRLRTFLRLLKNDGMIDFKSNTKLTQIILLNWDSYQDSKSQTNIKQITNKSQPNTKKKNKEVKKNKEKDINIRENEFINKSVAAGLKILPNPHPTVVEAFCDYWTERNVSGRKMRFELGNTFDIGRRLKRWIRNNEEWSKDMNGVGTKEMKEKDDIVEKRYREQMRRMREADKNVCSDEDRKKALGIN